MKLGGILMLCGLLLAACGGDDSDGEGGASGMSGGSGGMGGASGASGMGGAGGASGASGIGGMGGASGASGMGGAGGTGGSAGGDSPCFMVCDAQHAAETAGDCVTLSLEDCRALCGVGGSCQAQFEAMHVCWLTGEFMCGFFSAESNADCQAEEDAYFACIQ